MSDSSNAESCAPTTDNSNEAQLNNEEKDLDNVKETPRVKFDSVEYITRSDGSVVCKLCGEILQSRTHWYRHKYKLHVPQSLNPAPLFQCEQCLVFFKSRKGYIGHLASRHSEVMSDTSPVLTNAQVEAMAKEQQQIQQLQHSQLQQQQLQQLQQDYKDDLDAEVALSRSNVLNYQVPPAKQTTAKPPEQKKLHRNSRGSAETTLSGQEYDEKRIREEKLVSDIIDRVRRECEAQGSGGSARRGYSRRTTVMHT